MDAAGGASVVEGAMVAGGTTDALTVAGHDHGFVEYLGNPVAGVVGVRTPAAVVHRIADAWEENSGGFPVVAAGAEDTKGGSTSSVGGRWTPGGRGEVARYYIAEFRAVVEAARTTGPRSPEAIAGEAQELQATYMSALEHIAAAVAVRKKAVVDYDCDC